MEHIVYYRRDALYRPIVTTTTTTTTTAATQPRPILLYITASDRPKTYRLLFHYKLPKD